MAEDKEKNENQEENEEQASNEEVKPKPKKRVSKPVTPSKDAETSKVSRGRLDSVLKNLTKTYRLGKDSFRVYDNKENLEDVEVIPSGIPEINKINNKRHEPFLVDYIEKVCGGGG